MSDEAEAVVRAAHQAGLLVTAERRDRGVLRLRQVDDTLVGLVVVRADRVTHAEHHGVVFPFWPHGREPHDHELARLLEQIRTHP